MAENISDEKQSWFVIIDNNNKSGSLKTSPFKSIEEIQRYMRGRFGGQEKADIYLANHHVEVYEYRSRTTARKADKQHRVTRNFPGNDAGFVCVVESETWWPRWAEAAKKG